MAAVYHSAQRSGSVLPGRAHSCCLSTLGCLTLCHVKTVQQHRKRNTVIPSPMQYSISCLWQHMPKKTILQGWRLFLKPGSPAVGSSREAQVWLPKLQAAAGRRSHLPVLLPKADYKLKSNLLNL